MIDEIARQEMPALRASNLFKALVTTPSRAWLLNVDPSGLHRYFQQEVPEIFSCHDPGAMPLAIPFHVQREDPNPSKATQP
jgi:hypothetical protein